VDLAGKQVVVVGLARSGIAAAELLARRQARVVATDQRPASELAPEAVSLGTQGVRLELGGHLRESFVSADLVVVSPGVRCDLPELQAARAAGVAVISELELGTSLIAGTVAAVTGTKGKSTTTAALGRMLREAGRDVRVGGNIGQAVTGLVEGSSADTVFVLEVSSFQLEATRAFHPRVAVFLNLSPDHLDRHPSFHDYARTKARIFANQTEQDWAVVNADDPAVLALAREGRARVLPFHPTAPSIEGAYFDGPLACLRRDGAVETLFSRGEVLLPGRHLAADLLAAAAAARLLGATPDAVGRAVRGFTGAEHVLEHVADIGGVSFFDDSKATNVEAARNSIEAFERPVHVILGGRYKGGDFADLLPAVKAHVRTVLGIGEARDRLREALQAAVPVVLCDSLVDAVRAAHAAATPGDVVLLAPGCSSFDMFRDYAHRGQAFKDEVCRLAEEKTRAGARAPHADG
jgi:UDP-N-acetylmuramoylalanine--D-glutamate ligase